MNHIEQQIVQQVIQDALAAGFRLTVDNLEDSSPVRHSQDAGAVLAAMTRADENYLYLSRHAPGDHEYIGWVHFVYGNDSHDVIDDYTVNLQQMLTNAEALADRLAADAYGYRIYHTGPDGQECLAATVNSVQLIAPVMQLFTDLGYTTLRCPDQGMIAANPEAVG